MVFVKLRETYDLSTKTNKMGMIGIHTPSMDVVSRSWSGLVQNHKKIKLVSCDVKMACASILPADPLQVGVEAGDIAPQDMFNPILYKAVSNDSFGTLETRLYSLGYFNSNQSASVDYDQDPLPDSVDNWGVYYAMLSQGGFKKAMPQQGLQMKSLVPIVHQVVENRGENMAFGDSDFNDVSAWDKHQGVLRKVTKAGAILKGPSMRMPAIPTMYWDNANHDTEEYGSTIDARPTVLPATFVACILMPPAKLNKLYFRMTVSWLIEFIEPRSNVELSSLSNLEYEGLHRFYYTDYVSQSAKLNTARTSFVDTQDVDAKQIM